MTSLLKNMSETKSYNVIKYLQEAKDLANEIKTNLPDAYDIASISVKSKLPLKALALREAIIHRVSELSEVACQLYESKKVISAFIITRSLIETVAILYFIYDKIKKVNNNKDIDNVDHFFMRLLHGCRDIQELPDSYNILTAIDKIDKIFEGFRKMYDDLSEFAHPNSSGLTFAYSEVDMNNYKMFFGVRDNIPISFGLSPLVACLHIFIYYYNKFGELMPAFIEICNLDADKKIHS